MQGKKITIDQGKEALDLLSRLSPDQYQARRAWLGRISDPKFNPNMLKLDWPFKDQRPMEWGWKGVEREGAPLLRPVDISKLETVPFHEEGETIVNGEEMVRRAADAEAFPGCESWGMHQAEDILERADELPEEFRQYVLVFADTVLLGKGGLRYVAYLFWLEVRWQLDWIWLDFVFYRYFRFLRSRE